ncbi:MAG: 30S ribosomal protein S6 [Chloroflexota bacterium]|nr:30S ribosomal protein S6 [Chloroflexota bacterium]
MRRYELMLLLRPDLEDDKLQSAVEKVTRAIVNAGGSLSKVSPWGKRRLAYEIQHLRDASYFLIHFDIDPSEVRGIERGLLISEEILRHLVIVLEDRRAGSEDEELVPAVAERQPEPGAPGAEASSEPSEGQSLDYGSEITEVPGTAEETEAAGEAEPAEQPVAKA